jgi:hypothetical protein
METASMSKDYSSKDLLMMLAGKHADIIPQGWYSRKAVGEIMGVGRTCANEMIQGLQQQGHVLEVRQFKMTVAGGSFRKTAHYRFSPEAEAILKGSKNIDRK